MTIIKTNKLPPGQYGKGRRAFVVILALATMTAMTGCATGWQASAKKAVVASTQVYDLAMTIAGNSNVSAAKQAEIIKIANIYRAAATAALAAADVNDQASYNANVAIFAKAITDLTNLLNGHADLRQLHDAITADRQTFHIPTGATK